MQTKIREQCLCNESGTGERKKPLIIISEGPGGLSGWRLTAKNVVDLLAVLIILPFFLLISAVIGIAIKIESKGPVFFRQTRVGLGGRYFTLYKFRSMYEGSDGEDVRKSLEHLNEADGPVFKIKNDPRITKVGAFLRRTSLDEVPQAINVLKGDMSLVGPRPPLPCEVEKYTPRELGRLAVKPGLTCLWQIQGRSNISFERWVDMDLEYIRSQSLWLDFKIFIKTFPAVIKGNGAW